MVDNQQNLVFLESAFGYRNIAQSKTIYHNVNLCFHDSPSKKRNYFFAGNSMFFNEWDVFKDQLQLSGKPKSDYEFEILPLHQVKNPDSKIDYLFQFDMKIFENYDKNPIKVFKTQHLENCDVYAGEFFMSRWVLIPGSISSFICGE